jgi:hypothetical protein
MVLETCTHVNTNSMPKFVTLQPGVYRQAGRHNAVVAVSLGCPECLVLPYRWIGKAWLEQPIY